MMMSTGPSPYAHPKPADVETGVLYSHRNIIGPFLLIMLSHSLASSTVL